MIFIKDWALIDSEIRKREKFVSSKKQTAPTDFHDLEGKPDVDRVMWIDLSRDCNTLERTLIPLMV